MAITVSQLFDGRTSSYSDDGQRKHTLKYQAITDSKSTGSVAVTAAVVSATSIDYGTAHPDDAAAFCRNISTNPVTDVQWTVEYSFSTYLPEEEEALDNPLDRPCIITWDGQFFEVSQDYEADGTSAITDSAGIPFDPAIKDERSIGRLTVTKNYSSFDGSATNLYRNKINSDTFFGFAIGQVLCRNITTRSVTESIDGTNVTYYPVTFEFLVQDSWDAEILDAGFHYLDGTNPVQFLIGGQPVTQPQFLDGSGNPSDTPVKLTFTVKESTAFSGMGITCS